MEIETVYPRAFVEAIMQSAAWKDRTVPMRYVHCSGVLAERDQSKRLWFLQEGRRAKVCMNQELRLYIAIDFSVLLTLQRVVRRLNSWLTQSQQKQGVYGRRI